MTAHHGRIMRHLIHASCATLALVAATSAAQPWSRPLRAAADAIDDAHERAERSSGPCRTQIAPGLHDLEERVEDLRKQPDAYQQLNQLRFELALLGQQAPFAACSIGVTEGIQRALDELEAARVAMWGGRGQGRKGGAPAPVVPFVQLAPIQVALNQAHQGEQAVQLSLPEVRFEALQGQGFYVATRFRSFEGNWSEWVTTQVWTVPTSPFVWRNAYTHLIRYSTLAAEDYSNGRFIAHVAIFGAQGQELAFREATFRVNLPPPPVVVQPPPVVVQPPTRDCGTGPNDPGCLMTRDGRFAMDAATYQGVTQALRDVMLDARRAELASSLLATNYLTAAQLRRLLDLFAMDNARFDFAQRAAPRVVDPQHAIGFSSRFTFSRNRAAYAQLMARQPHGVPWQPGVVVPGPPAQPPLVVQPGVFVQQPGMPMPAVVQPGVMVQVPGPQPLPPPPPAVGLAVRDCGTGPSDPGCGLMRNGFAAMDAAAFGGMLQALRGTMNEIVREQMFQQLVARQGLTALQLSQVLDLFANGITRLDVARHAAPRVVNPQHAIGLSAKFSNSISAQEFVELYAAQR